MEEKNNLNVSAEDLVNDLPPEEEILPTIADISKHMEESGTPFPQEVEEAITSSFTRMFSLGMRTAANAVLAVVYERIGNGKTDFETLEKEQLVELLTKVKDFCEVGMSDTFLETIHSSQEKEKENAENSSEKTSNEEGSSKETGTESQADGD